MTGGKVMVIELRKIKRVNWKWLCNFIITEESEYMKLNDQATGLSKVFFYTSRK